jgi:hypothetical protein
LFIAIPFTSPLWRDPPHITGRSISLASFRPTRETFTCANCPRAKGAPDRRQVWRLLVMRKIVIVAVMSWAALASQDSHVDFGRTKVEAVK